VTHYFKKKAARATAGIAVVILFTSAVAFFWKGNEVELHRRALQHALMQQAPDSPRWSRVQKIARSMRKPIPLEKLPDEMSRHRAKLLELGYFRLVELTIPTPEAFHAFNAGGFTNKWQCDLWSFSGYTGTVHLTAFTGDIPAWLQLAETSSQSAVTNH
jgi:hypothetical protein